MQETVDTAGRLYTVEEFLAEYAGHERKVELVDGRVVEVSPDISYRGRLKATVTVALQRAIDEARRSLAIMIDGPALRTGGSRVRVPDVVVVEEADDRSRDIAVERPAIAVEILSETTAETDTESKLGEYLAIPTLCDYVIVAPSQKLVAHHARQSDGTVATLAVGSGKPALAAGLEIDVGAFWPHED